MTINKEHCSLNFNRRARGQEPGFIILHFTAMDSADEAITRLCAREHKVSAHYLIGEDGEVIGLVDEEMRAWHAGESYWGGERDMNSASIGIELDNNGARPFTGELYEALIALLAEICGRRKIPPQNVLGHSDISIGRKFDPGPWFNWPRLDEAGVSAPPQASGKFARDEAGFRKAALSAGYDGAAELGALLASIRIRHGATPYFSPLREKDFALLGV